YMKQDNKGLIYSNLVDFDSKYGHRRDPEGYKKALEEFDSRLPALEILSLYLHNSLHSDILSIPISK
ncbi:hypothetical protein ACTPEM_24145, partial [Clostridioides difficile]